MKNRGFTLVELLAVITIISLLALLTSTAVTRLLDKSKSDLSEIQIELIKSAAMSWGSENTDYLPNIGRCSYVTLKDLKDSGFVDSGVIDAKTNKKVSDDLKIKITTKVGANGYITPSYEVNSSDIDSCSWAMDKNFRPQYYFFSLDEEGYDNNIYGYSAIGKQFTNEKTTVPPEGRDFYLGLDLNSSDIVTSAYLCFVRNGKEYCLKVGEIDRDIEILKGAFSFQNVCSNSTMDLGVAYQCSTDSFEVYINLDGGVGATGTGNVGDYTGTIYCHSGTGVSPFTCYIV